MYRIERYGKVWDIDSDESLGQEGLIDEDHYNKLFQPKNREQSLQPTDNWLDIGANIGAFAIRAAEFVQSVTAVEPEQGNLDCLYNNCLINGARNISIVEAAIVGGDETSVPLALSKSYSSTHRVGKIRGRETVEVMAININDIVAEQSINKIKCDCEGSEPEILEALDLTEIDEIIFEYHFSFIKDRPWERYFDIIEKLENEGFEILRGPRERSGTWHSIVWARRL